MRIETRQILGDQFTIFAQADPAGLIVHQPTADQRIAAFELGQRVELLHDHAFFAVRAIDARDLLAVLHDLDIGAFA
ncbi:hypothetical protein D3C71_1173760 [compost metagenome]